VENLTERRYVGKPCTKHPHNNVRYKCSGSCVRCVKDSANRARRKRNKNIKLECFKAYGGPVCCDCGIDDMDVLTLDHINEGGAADRLERFGNRNQGGERLYMKLKQEGWPKGFAIRCFNCNYKKHLQIKNKLSYYKESEV